MMHVRCASLFSPECTLSVSSSISGGSKRKKVVILQILPELRLYLHRTCSLMVAVADLCPTPFLASQM